MLNFKTVFRTLKFICACMLVPLMGQAQTIIAHRGASGFLPEHTLESYAYAHALNCDYIEIDVILTKDNHLVALHDIHLERTTNVNQIFPHRRRKDGRYYAIDFTLSELKKLSVHERTRKDLKTPVYPHRFPLFKSSFKIPTFQEIVDLVSGLNQSTHKNVGLYIEIKDAKFHADEQRDIVKIFLSKLKANSKKLERVYIQSFEPEVLKRLRFKMQVTYPLTQLIGDESWLDNGVDYTFMRTLKGLAQVKTYADAIGPWIDHLYTLEKPSRIVPSSLSSDAKGLGLIIHPFTFRIDSLPPGFKDKDTLSHFLFKTLLVDGVFTDFPQL